MRRLVTVLLPGLVPAWVLSPLRTVGRGVGVARTPRVLSLSSHNPHDDDDDDNAYDYHSYDVVDATTTATSPGWSVTDDWTALSASEHPVLEGRDVFHQDVLGRAAHRLEAGTHPTELSDAEVWLHRSIERILNPDEEEEDDHEPDGWEDSSPSSSTTTRHETLQDQVQQLEEEGNEVARLVRCQEIPQALLVQQGRAVSDLTWEAAHDVRQLVAWNATGQHWQATAFLHEAVGTLFATHAVPSRTRTTKNNDNVNDDSSDTTLPWDATAVASWMRQSLQEPCGPHDPRVTTVLSRFGRAGALPRSGLVDLYVHAIVDGGDGGSTAARTSRRREKAALTSAHVEGALERFQTQPSVQAVWRDLKRHGIPSPAEQHHEAQVQAVAATHNSASMTAAVSPTASNLLVLDECELFEEGTATDEWHRDEETGVWEYRGKSSHQLVQLAADDQTPLFLQDGDYVYIDEESCIGCTQCALAAPSSFRMLDTGRARTFVQRGRTDDVRAAVKTCPVNCMHYVNFDRLKTLEEARDSANGDDGRLDHRHFGRDRRNDKWRAHTPLHVSRMESSDANHKDSLYHHIRRQCYQSKECPSKGCYDCPLHASNPEGNPHLAQRRATNNHERFQTFVANGSAEHYRHTADL